MEEMWCFAGGVIVWLGMRTGWSGRVGVGGE